MSVVGDLRARYRRRPVFVVVAAIALAYFLAWPFVDSWLRSIDIATSVRFSDFGAYTGAIDRWQAGQNIYVQDADGGYFGSYLYPPLALLLFYPFVAIFEFREAAMAFELVSLALLWIGMQLVVRELGYRLEWWERVLVLWAIVGFHPLLWSLKWGQTAAFTTATLCFAFVALARQERGSPDAGLVSGALTGVVGFVKLAYAPVGAHLLDDRDRLTGAVSAWLLLVGLSVGVFGVAANLQYLDVLAWGIEYGSDPRSPTRWLPPYFAPLGWLPGSTLLRVVLSAVLAGAAILSEDRTRSIFAMGVAAFPVLAPTTYAYYLTALLPAGLIVMAGEFERDGYPTIPLVGLLLANAHAYGLYLFAVFLHPDVPVLASNDWLYFLLQPGLWGAGLIAGLAFVRVTEGIDPEAVRERYLEHRERVELAGRRLGLE